MFAEIDEGDFLAQAQLAELLSDLVGGEDAADGFNPRLESDRKGVLRTMKNDGRMQNHAGELPGGTDDELVSRAQEGDGGAFSELARRHQSGCTKLAYSILRDRQDAEDEVRNAMWKAFEHIRQFQRDAKLTTWLTRIVVNQCLMRPRRARRARFVYIDGTAIGDAVGTLEPRDTRKGPDHELGREKIAWVLHGEIRRIRRCCGTCFCCGTCGRCRCRTWRRRRAGCCGRGWSCECGWRSI